MSPVDRKSERGQTVRDGVTLFGCAAAITIGLVVLALAVWAFKVWLAPLVGLGNVHRDQNSSRNQEHWSAVYNSEYSQLLSDKTSILLLSRTYQSSHSPKDLTDLNGNILNCQQDVARYNADTHNVLGAQWLPSRLPADASADDFCSAPASPSPTAS